MKYDRVTLILVLFFVVLPAFIVRTVSAQIVFNESDVLALIPGTISGESFTVGNDQNAGIQALLDINGANQTWDFTTLTWPGGTAITQDYVALPNGTLPGENDPRVANATYAVRILDGLGKNAADETATYFSTSSTQHLVYGTFGMQGGEIFDALYDTPILANPFPLMYLSAWQDQTTWTLESQGITVNVTQADDATVSGWGTLVLPSGSFQVLKLTVARTSTSQIGANPPFVTTTTVVTFISNDLNTFASISAVPDILNPGSFFLGAGYGAPSQGGGDPPATPPGNTQPPNGTQFTDTPVLAWDPVAGADTYDLQVDTEMLGKTSTLVIDEVGLTNTNYVPLGLDPDATYHWHVRGVNGGGAGPWTDSANFTTAAAPPALPGAVTLTTPADAATEVVTMPTLSWNASTDATSYDVQVATDAGFTLLHSDLPGVAITQATVGPLNNKTSYYWRVRGVNGQGIGDWSAGWIFETIDSPTSVEKVDGEIPSTFALYPNYPNPFNPSTTILFDIPETSAIRLSVFDALGREVAVLADRQFAAGQYRFNWDAKGMESGLYIYRLVAGSVQKTGTMILLK